MVGRTGDASPVSPAVATSLLVIQLWSLDAKLLFVFQTARSPILLNVCGILAVFCILINYINSIMRKCSLQLSNALEKGGRLVACWGAASP